MEKYNPELERKKSIEQYGPCKNCGRAKYDHAPPYEYAALLSDQLHGCYDGFQSTKETNKYTHNWR